MSTDKETMKVLVVDDEGDICEALARALTKEGFAVITSENATTALQKVREHEISVALVDRMLGGGEDGIATIYEIKKINPLCQTILMTGFPTYESAAATIGTQSYAYLTKPLKLNQIYSTVFKAAEEYQKKRKSGIQMAFFKSLFEESPAPVILCNAQGVIQFINPAFEKLFSCSETEVCGSEAQKLLNMSRDVLSAEIQEAGKNGSMYEYETTVTGKAGRSLCLKASMTACSDPLSGFEGCLIRLQDMTEIKKMQEELMQAEKMSILGSIAAKLAHEINNPTQIITGYTELLLENATLSEAVKSQLKMIRDASLMIRNLNTNLLDLARPRPSILETFRPEEPLEKAIVFLTKAGQIKHYKIIKEYLETIPRIRGDFQQLNQVYLNLLMNASHALQEKKEKILHVKTHYEQNSRFVGIWLRDNGCGIPKEHREKIFDHFFTTREGKGGTGLGLPLVKSIVEWHGGKIDFESEPGAGTTFVVSLPIAAAADSVGGR